MPPPATQDPPMRSRRAATALAAAALVALAVPVAAAASTEVSTSIAGLSWTDADGATDHFDGAISSAAKKCVKGRRVSLYKKQAGPDTRLARLTTDKSGAFAIEREDPGSGRYYVKVKRAEVGDVTCKRAISGPLAVEDLEGV
jgi:hypothetical protein